MKHLALLAIALLVCIFLNACASEEKTASAGDPVPGEKVSEESRVAPSGTGPNASVKW